MTLRTALVIDGDSEGAQRALAAVDDSMKRAEAEAKALAAAYSAADVATSRLASAQTAAKAANDATKASFAASEITVEEYNRQLLETKTAVDLVASEHRQAVAALKQAQGAYTAASSGIGSLGQSARLSRQHVANLGFQLQDIVVALQMGQNPFQVFLQQGGQIGQIMGQAGIGVGRLTTEIAGMAGRFAMAHPILLGVGAAAGVAYAGFAKFRGEVEKSGELDRYANSLGLTKKEMEELGPTTLTAGDAISGLWRTIDEGLGLSEVFASIASWAASAFDTMLRWGKNAIAGIYAGFVGTYNGIKSVWGMLPAVISEAVVGAANLAVAALEKLVNLSIGGLNTLTSAVNSVLGTDFAKIAETHFARFQNQSAGAGKAAAGAFGAAYSSAFNEAMAGMDRFGGRLGDNIVQAAKDRLSAKAGDLIDDRAEKKAGDGGKRLGRKIGDEAAKEMAKALEDAAQFMERLQDEIATMGMDAIQKKWREINAAANKAPLDELRQAILNTGAAWEKAFRDQADEDFNRDVIRPLMTEAQLLGLVGEKRELASLALEEEGFKAEWLAKGLGDVNDAWERYVAWREHNIKGESALERDREQAELLSNELQRIIGALSGLGGVGGAVGGLLGFASGNMSSIGGPIGAILNTMVGTRTDEETGKTIARTIGDELRSLFGDDDFWAPLQRALQSAGLGMMAGGIVGGNGTTNQIGGAVGGILGSLGGEAFKGAATKVATSIFGDALGAAIGSAVPVIGTILGGIAGNLLGGLIGGVKKGSVMIGDVGGALGVTGTTGDSSIAAAAQQNATAIVDALKKVADALGGTLNAGAGRVSIGTRDGDYRVDPYGNGQTRMSDPGVMDFGQDAQAAVAAAMKNLIQDGVITGIRESTQRLLQSGNDLDAQLQKALAFEGVFKALKEQADPAKAALEQLDKEFAGLKAIFDEAGASAEERAQLDALYEKRKAELGQQTAAIDESANKRRELEIALMTAQGDVMGALAAARADELAKLDPSLRALQQQVWAAQLASDQRQLEIQLLEAQGDATAALTARRQIELAQLDASLRPIQQQVWAAQDAAAAQAELARTEQETADHARQVAEKRRELEIQLLEAQGNASGALAERRQIELDALDASLRPLQERIYQLNDEKAAAEASTQAAEESARAAEAAAKAEADLARTRRSLEAQILELQGDAAGAIAAKRQLELEAIDASLRPLQELIYQLSDAKAAAEELTRQQAEASRAAQELAAHEGELARQRSQLEIRLLDAEGDAVGALALRRQQEIDSTDASLRALLQQVYAAEDAASAEAQLARARDAAASSAAAAASQEADLARQRTQLQIELLQALGKADEATALQHETTLAGLDPSLRDLQQQVWDAQAAAAAAAEAQRQYEDAMRAAEQAAQEAAQIERQRVELQVQLLQLMGQTIEAVALKRQQELAALEPSLRALQQQVWALQDAKAAEEERTKAIEQARSTLSEAYKREADALHQTIDKFRSFGTALREFRGGLFATDAGMADAYRQAQVKFLTTSALAATGDETALGQLQGVSSAFLQASKAQASSLVQYQRDVAAVARAVDHGIAASDEAVDYAQLQLQALDRSVTGLIDINANVVSVRQAIEQLEALMADRVASAANPVAAASPVAAANDPAQSTAPLTSSVFMQSNAELADRVTQVGHQLHRLLQPIQQDTAHTRRIFERMDDTDGLLVRVVPS